MTILTIVQDVAVLVGLSRPTVAMTSNDATIQQIVAFIQQDGDELANRFDWRNIKVAGQIVGDGTTTMWNLPTDFSRFLPGDALWSLKYPAIPLGGPLTDEEMIAMQALPIQPVRPVWRLLGNQIEIWPALASAEVVNHQYRSFYWIVTYDGATRQPRWGVDTDYSVIPERLLTLGGVWRWKRAKGLDYAEEFVTYQREVERMAGQDSGPRTIRTARGIRPDGIYGQTPVNPIIVT